MSKVTRSIDSALSSKRHRDHASIEMMHPTSSAITSDRCLMSRRTCPRYQLQWSARCLWCPSFPPTVIHHDQPSWLAAASSCYQGDQDDNGISQTQLPVTITLVQSMCSLVQSMCFTSTQLGVLFCLTPTTTTLYWLLSLTIRWLQASPFLYFPPMHSIYSILGVSQTYALTQLLIHPC